MSNYSTTPPVSTASMSRSTLLTLLDAALQTQELRYARQIALGWLAFFPGDLLVKLKYAQALYGLDSEIQAIGILDEICQTDPEFLAALHFRYKTTFANGIFPGYLIPSLFILDDTYPGQIENFTFLQTFRRSYQWLKNQDRPLALWEANTIGLPTGQKANGSLLMNPENPLAFPLLGVIHLRCLIAQQADNHAVHILAQEYLERWPECLAFKLILAKNEMASDPVNGVTLLHEAVALDTTAQVAERMWGERFPFKKIWPGTMEVAAGHPTSPQSLPVPASVSAMLGWNQLPIPSLHDYPKIASITETSETYVSRPSFEPKKINEEVVEEGKQTEFSTKSNKPFPPYPIISELRQIAKSMNQPALSRVDGRYPVYVILSTRQGLVNKYGEQGASLVLECMYRLSETITQYRHWDSLVLLVDQPDLGPSRTKIMLDPAPPNDPWAIKLALVDLDTELGKFGEMIGALMIVGGPEIIPFHLLPNPVDDTDKDVPSDNPYATRDENYFVPEWPVGRIPSGYSANPEMLIRLLRNSRRYHEKILQTGNGFKKFWQSIRDILVNFLKKPWHKHGSFGYSAAIWRRASLSVFRPIGDPHRLIVSPPVEVKPDCALQNPKKTCFTLPSGRLAYFNLHGLADTDEWYGQRDPVEPGDAPDFPLAFRAADIPSNGHSRTAVPEIVFSEACFGGHIVEKKVDEAIALKFLSNGSRVVVGSTCISYGSIGTPLIAADLLGHTFWHYLKDGQPAGEALRRARIRLVKEMNQRQGYLDGEDQKTLLSFVFYGDPLIQINHLNRGPKSILRSNKNQSVIPIVCDKIVDEAQTSKVPQDVITQVKAFVAEYLPGMADAEMHFSRERVKCDGNGHVCPASQLHSKSNIDKRSARRQVVTLSKTIHENTHSHAQFARMTLDESGKMVKLVVSR